MVNTNAALASWDARERSVYETRTPRSAELFKRASRVMPGGDTRYSLAMHPYPTYVDEGHGTHVLDADGNAILDLIYNATSLIHGHAHPAISAAVQYQAGRGTSVLAPNSVQVELAEELCGRVGSLERVRFTNSGTEATMSMIKVARAFSRCDTILKIDGAYHGTFDGMEFNAVQPGAEEASPYTGGVPRNLADNLVMSSFNDTEGVVQAIERHADRLAGVIVTPMGSMGTWIPPRTGFLEAVREQTRKHGVLLLFDEVIAFRLSRGGAQERYGVVPDLTAFGKVIGGGLPVGAFGGRADVMSVTDPTVGPKVALAGTFNGNPLTAAAGLAALRLLDGDAYAKLESLGRLFAQGLDRVIVDLALPLEVRQQGSLVAVTPTPDAPVGWAHVNASMRMALLNREVLGWGVFALPTVMEPETVKDALGRIHDALQYPAKLLGNGDLQ